MSMFTSMNTIMARNDLRNPATVVTLVTDGLIMHLDASNVASYTVGSPTIRWYDLTANSLDMFYDTDVPAFVPDAGGSFCFTNGSASADTFDQADNALTEAGETWSVCWWSKHAVGSSSTSQYIFSKLTNRLAIIAGYQSGHVNAFINAGYRPTAASTQMPFTEEEWTHFCYTKDSNGGSDNWKGYVNGVEYFSLSTDFTVTDGTTFHIGSTGTGAAQFQGKVGEWEWYDRALTAAEVLQNYNATQARYQTTTYDALNRVDTGANLTINKDDTGSPPVDATGTFDYGATSIGGTSGIIRASRARSTGKYYFECSWQNVSSGTGTCGVGLCQETLANTVNTYSQATGTWAVWGRNAGARHANANTIAFTTTANERFGFACDLDNSKMWIWHEAGSPQWIQGDPETDTSPVWSDLSGALTPFLQPWFTPSETTFHATPASLANPSIPTGYTAGWPS